MFLILNLKHLILLTKIPPRVQLDSQTLLLLHQPHFLYIDLKIGFKFVSYLFEGNLLSWLGFFILLGNLDAVFFAFGLDWRVVCWLLAAGF